MDNTNKVDTRSSKADPQSTVSLPAPKDLKYPKSVFFIIGNEFCERFCFYGMKAVLVLYFTRVLVLTDDEATQSYHEFILFCYFTPLFGAILADSYLGKFDTILYLSLLYALGNIALSAASYIENGLFSIISLGLIAFGTGGIKPCVSAFGGDQFVVGQEDQLNKFFALFYMSINLGSLFSTFITPILRSDVSCSSRGDCFPLAFGVPAALMTIAVVLFIAGKRFYRIVGVAKGNVIFKYFHCNVYAIGLKLEALFSSKKGLEKRDHWLDYAEDKFSPKLINEVKIVNQVLFLYLPLPLFWALFDQQGSRWTLQALKMDGIIYGDLALKPDQLQVINPVLIVALIPVFQYGVYPLTNKLGLFRKPLQRMTVGGLLAGAAFALAALLQISLELEVPRAPAVGFGAITLINTLPCAIKLTSVHLNSSSLNMNLDSGSAVHLSENLPIGVYKLNVDWASNCPLENSSRIVNPMDLVIHDRAIEAIQFYARKSNEPRSNYVIKSKNVAHSLPKPDRGDSAVQVAYSTPLLNQTKDERKIIFSKLTSLAPGDPEVTLVEEPGLTNYSKLETFSGVQSFRVVFKHNLESNYTVKVRNGAAYILAVVEDPISGEFIYKLNKIVDENHMSMLWQIPQYFVITCGEVMFSITGLEFSYSQAPASMKSVVSAAWLLTVSFGNLLVALITKYVHFEKQSIAFSFFAGLMVCDMIIFAIIACLYTYSNQALDDGSGNDSTSIRGEKAKSQLPSSEMSPSTVSTTVTAHPLSSMSSPSNGSKIANGANSTYPEASLLSNKLHDTNL